MKTIRLLYPDHVSGGLETYYFGANLLQHILPHNEEQLLVKVDVIPPNGKEKEIVDGIYGKDEIIFALENANAQIEKENPDRIITIGGNCLVSFAPFDYLHGKYENVGIVWFDAHPDVSKAENGYPNAHAMVLGSLMGYGDSVMTERMKNKPFDAKDILYIGLQEIHDYQKSFLDETGVNYKIQTENFVKNGEIKEFVSRYDHILLHLDIDVLDASLFHSTYFANKELVGDGAGSGKMTMEKLGKLLKLVEDNSSIKGFTVAEYLPFDEHKLHQMFSKLNLFKE
ncbi:arginase [Aequitasia blattaphilus]|uniref:Arginase family protein n=1 Tax=Aequitasia blattaphilus TaxID=2949332 RepID=A0ABT1E586_9FIRM|nr:arginase family protein [Aequitasia blattaphilus]MCP1100908.1 arginase family protein [Aequitasia blattaphilus]MCR8613548.1 arginase family protein [Aequitasia blattaphilus]